MPNSNNDSKVNRIKDEVCRYLEDGMYKKDAALMAGISEKTLYRWIKEDDSFDSRIEASILRYKYSLIKNLNEQMKRNGSLALKTLQQRWPNEWLKPQFGEGLDRKSASQEAVELLQEILRKPDYELDKLIMIEDEDDSYPELEEDYIEIKQLKGRSDQPQLSEP